MPMDEQDQIPQRTREFRAAVIGVGARASVARHVEATGGRVVHHLQSVLPHADNAVVLTGYQACGTPGRLLGDGATELRLYGRYVPVWAQIVAAEGSPYTPMRTSSCPGSRRCLLRPNSPTWCTAKTHRDGRWPNGSVSRPDGVWWCRA